MATLNSNVETLSRGPSLQVADVVIVSADTRGFSMAKKLAQQGWKTVVVELSGSSFNSEIEWADRLGPFLGWESEGNEATDREGSSPGSKYPALWLPSGPVSFGGRTADAGAAHLGIRYGIPGDGKKSESTLEKGWPEALAKSVVASRLARREAYVDGSAGSLKLPWGEPVKDKVSAEAVGRARREAALAAGARVLEAEQITAVRISDGRVDRVEFHTGEGLLVERTRSLVWMLSEEESRRVEFVGPDVSLGEFLETGRAEPLMAWWRSRLAVRGLKHAATRALTRVPETPPHVVVIGSIERPWTHDNLLLLDVVEETPEMRVFDVWARIPYWARVDHVYRDEQRLLMQRFLADRLVGCELIWVTPSPLALTEPAIRMPHVIYDQDSVPAKGRPENVCFAGPETWAGIGLQGLRPMEPRWLSQLEDMRIQWDPVARLKASRIQKAKYTVKNLVRRVTPGRRANDEVVP